MTPDAIITLVSPLLPGIFTQLAKVVRKFRTKDEDFNENFEKLGLTMLKIQSHVDDAETKTSFSNFYRVMIEDCKTVLFDAGDSVEKIALDLGRLDSEENPKKRKKKINSYKEEILADVKMLQQKLTGLAAEMEKCFISEMNQPRHPQTVAVPQIGSMVDEGMVNEESSVIGRDDDKQQILEFVFNQRQEAAVSVIPIVGMVGIGKTTLAQLVFNYVYLIDEFILPRMWWVSVTPDDDVLEITKSILESAMIADPAPAMNVDPAPGYSSLDWFQKKLKRIVERPDKFFLVLDGMCDENPIKWESLKVPFIHAAPGSIIMVTTRSEIVSSMVTTRSAYCCLDVLSDENCWKIIKGCLRRIPSRINDLEANGHGLRIAQKCNGLPLVAKVIGSELRLKSGNVEYWNGILGYQIWNLAKEKNHIYPALKFCYDQLPNHLKKCFAYASLFPHSRPFGRDDMIKLWEAEGLIQSQGTRTTEDIGREYFHDLCSRSIFRQWPNNTGTAEYEMHGFIHELARSVATDVCFAYEDGKSQSLPILKDVRHWSLIYDENFKSATFDKFSNHKKWRTFMLFSFYKPDLQNVMNVLLGKLLWLRVLNLSGSGISELSENIGNLLLLHYLNLSGTLIEKLPDSIEKLFGLKSLIIENCPKLQNLPHNLIKLMNLRYIDRSDLISKLPSIGKLASLETLSVFLVETTAGKKIEELKDMRCLRGSICIKQLENVLTSAEAMAAKLKDKQYLDRLELQWAKERTGTTAAVDNEVLTALKPFHTIKELQVRGYSGTTFPDWMGTSYCRRLVKMELIECASCTLLPSVGQLPLLKDLWMEDMKSLKDVNNTFCGPEDSRRFPSLERLKFVNMQTLERWEGIRKDDMPCLRKLTMENCPRFQSLPSLIHLASLEELEINECPDLASFPDGGLPGSLQKLIIFASNQLEQSYCAVQEGDHWNIISRIPYIETTNGLLQRERH